jgi:exopolysaccharide biosynthesis predicted pyruvyltransferase EpsI
MIQSNFVSSLISPATEALRKALNGHEQCAILDFPDYANVGDSAIWLGQIAALDALGVKIQYVATTLSLSPAVLRQRMKRGVILVNGGGNFGTLWPNLQEHRERVLEEFKDYPVVQLPQSIFYGDSESLERTRTLIQAHPDFTLMVRDEPSRQLATERLGAKTIVCTDSAFFLNGTLRRGRPQVDILVLARTDKERVTSDLEGALAHCGRTFDIADWVEEPMTWSRRVAVRVWPRAFGRLTQIPGFFAVLRSLWNAVALARVRRGSELLSRGRVVVTDRLHAHIMCLLLDIPHVVLDNAYGKVQSFVAQWTHASPLVKRASSGETAIKLAVAMLSEQQAGLVPVPVTRGDFAHSRV